MIALNVCLSLVLCTKEHFGKTKTHARHVLSKLIEFSKKIYIFLIDLCSIKGKL